jgi:hypothetical protein
MQLADEEVTDGQRICDDHVTYDNRGKKGKKRTTQKEKKKKEGRKND